MALPKMSDPVALERLQYILRRMLGSRSRGPALPLFDPEPWLAPSDIEAGADVRTPDEGAAAALNAAFLIAACGSTHPASQRAAALLAGPPPGAPQGLAAFYRRGLALMREEIEEVAASDDDLLPRLTAVAEWMAATDAADDGPDEAATAEILWSLFFPEGLGIVGNEERREAELRTARTVTIRDPGPAPIADPGRQLLFTSNVLLTVPAASRPIDALPYHEDLRGDLGRAAGEAQQHWYDHPIQIGVEAARNELLYGLRGLDEAVDFERRRSPADGRVTCVLSVSVTHRGLQGIARRYVEEELAGSGGLRHLDVLVFTEAETERLVHEVLAPAVERYPDEAPPDRAGDARGLLREVFGVDGEYGRHYSFLKAIAAFWQVLVDPEVRGTFKIDLDQVFPQEELVAQTSASAFEHLSTPLWGARGVDSAGRDVEMGMLAGALVNERDIGHSLFTPDVAYPARQVTPDEHFFFSALPQALSTRAEMMERYDSVERDGERTCLERIHVTGGTNGILVDALRRHRPFTPSFIGRAEDQAYILSTLSQPGPRLAYAHAAGLIMRHDKEAFAGEAIAAAHVGKLVGDDVRILHFSAYAGAIGGSGTGPSRDRAAVKALMDPFTGCFISRLPVTVVLLRFALRVARGFEIGQYGQSREYAENGAARISEALRFTADRAGFGRVIDRERLAWDRYYDALDALERALLAGDPEARRLRQRAQEIVTECRVHR